MKRLRVELRSEFFDILRKKRERSQLAAITDLDVFEYGMSRPYFTPAAARRNTIRGSVAIISVCPDALRMSFLM